MPTEKPDWQTPRDTQILSDRTVLRFQQIGNLLEEDLRSLDGFAELNKVIFAQRDWLHTSKDARFYNANFCTTYRLTDSALTAIVTDLTSALDKKPTSLVTDAILGKLFIAYDTLTGKPKADSYNAFTKALKPGNGNQLEIDKAHELLIEAASVIPYQGQLPTAFDGHCGEHLGAHWFSGPDGIDDSWTCLCGPQLKFSVPSNQSGWTKLVWPKPALSLHSTIDADLVPLLDDFLNPLLMGFTPAKQSPAYENRQKANKVSGLAFPCYEERSDDHFQGAFLGWIFLVFSTESPPAALTSSWDAFRFAVNHFADRIQEAIIEEILGEYGANHAGRSPEEAFAFYLPRVEGWKVNEPRHKQVILFRNTKRGSSPVEIGATWDTICDGSLSASLLMRCHRLHRGLKFVYDNSRVEAMRKHEQMLTLLAGPLQNLTESLATMQRDAQELRAVLYDPAKALFASHTSLAKLFEEDAEFQVSRDLRVMVAHNMTGYKGESHDDAASPKDRRDTKLNGQVILAVALCRLFGCEDKLNDAPSSVLLVERAKHELALRMKMPAFSDLSRDLKWLLKFEPDIEALFSMPSVALSAIKKSLFDPFKLSATSWHPSPFGLAMLPYLESRNGFTEQNVGEAWDNMPADWSPVPVNAVLSFLIDLCAEAASRKTNQRKVKVLQFSRDGGPGIGEATFFRIRCTFSGPYLDQPERNGWGLLKTLIEQHVLNDKTRDWRIQESHAGNFRRPYLDLAGRILGFGQENGQWRRANTTKDEELLVIERWTNESNTWKPERRFAIRLEIQNGESWEVAPKLVLAWETAQVTAGQTT